MSENYQRTKSSCDHKFSGTNCKKCGTYNHEKNQVVKTTHFESFLNCSAKKYLVHLRKRQSQVLENRQIGEGTWTVLQGVCEKFQYSTETLALGLYIFAKTYRKQEKDEKFWAASSLLVASKAIQLDKHVPYLNRYQKYAEKSYSQEDYEEAERSIFEQMKFDLQITTFLTFLHFYLTNGIMFQKDGLNDSAVRSIEDQLLYKAKQLLRNSSFIGHQAQKLALTMIKQVRIKHNLEAWPKQLETVSGVRSENIQALEKNNVLKPLCCLSIRAKQKLSSLSHHNTLTPLQNSVQLVDNKPKLIRRKNDSMMKSHVKENTFRAQPQIQQNLLTNIRKHNSSVSKCPAPLLSSCSNLVAFQKLVPLNFQTRRL